MSVLSKYLRNFATEGSNTRLTMGTIAVVVEWDNNIASNLSRELENYLEKEVNPKLDRLDRINNKLDKGNSYLIKGGYNKNIHGFIKGRKYIMVSSNPRPFFTHIPYFRITWHQSQWDDQREVAETFTDIFGVENTYTILCKSKIVRSDFWLDAELTYEQAKMSTFRPGVSVSDQRRGDRRSYYLGTKGHKQAVFYEKPTKSRENLDITIKGKTSIERLTRYEVRYFAKKVPIRTYANYIETAELDVFHHMKTCLFKIKNFLNASKVKKIKQDKINSFLRLVEREDLHHARKQFNKNRNFYRTIQPILDEVGGDLELSRRWKDKIHKKIIKDFDIIKYFNDKGVSSEE